MRSQEAWSRPMSDRTDGGRSGPLATAHRLSEREHIVGSDLKVIFSLISGAFDPH